MKCVFGKLIYTGTGVIENSYIAFENSIITGIGKEPKGEVIGKYEVISPQTFGSISYAKYRCRVWPDIYIFAETVLTTVTGSGDQPGRIITNGGVCMFW